VVVVGFNIIGFRTVPQNGSPSRLGQIAFDRRVWTFEQAWDKVCNRETEREARPDEEAFSLTCQGGMFVNGESYGTCQFCPDGFKARADHFIEKDKNTICCWFASVERGS
jgi:hypothetical protein